MISPTKRQMAVLRYVQGYQEAHGGVSPNYSEIAVGCGLSAKTKARVGIALNELEGLGLIRRLKNRARAIEILRPVSIPRDPDGRPVYFVGLPEMGE